MIQEGTLRFRNYSDIFFDVLCKNILLHRKIQYDKNNIFIIIQYSWKTILVSGVL